MRRSLAKELGQVLESELALVQMIKDDEGGRRVLENELAVVRAIRDDPEQARTLTAFLPVLTDPRPVLRCIRRATTNYLRDSLAYEKRKEVLVLCSDHALWAPILPQKALSAIAGHIIEICQEWEWL